MSAVVYEWPDGSSLKLQFLIEKEERTPILWFGNGWPPIVLAGGHPAGSSAAVLYLECPARPDEFEAALSKLDPDGAKKLIGFALDAGVDRFNPSWTGIVTTHGRPPTVLPYPRFVSDGEWEGRYELAKRRVAPWILGPLGADRVRGPFIGGISGLTIQHDPDRIHGYWYAKWTTENTESGTMSFEAGSMEEVVDECLAYELVLPLSKRNAWDRDHVLHGTFVLPDEEEVRVFRLLGETLPFFWGEERFKVWLDGKGVRP